MSEERLAYENYVLTRELDRRGDPSRDPCAHIGQELDAAQSRIAALQAENAALREFVAAYDAKIGTNAAAAFVVVSDAASTVLLHDARQRLATDYGIPLPGQEGER